MYVVSAFRRTRYGPADRLRQGFGGPPKLHAKAEAGHYVLQAHESGSSTTARTRNTKETARGTGAQRHA